MAAVDPDLLVDAQNMGGHQRMADAGRHMTDVIGSTSELILYSKPFICGL